MSKKSIIVLIYHRHKLLKLHIHVEHYTFSVAQWIYDAITEPEVLVLPRNLSEGQRIPPRVTIAGLRAEIWIHDIQNAESYPLGRNVRCALRRILYTWITLNQNIQRHDVNTDMCI
jgi:hypothetical protein